MEFLKTFLATFLALTLAYLLWLRHVSERSEIFKKQIELYADAWHLTGALSIYMHLYLATLQAGKMPQSIDLFLEIQKIKEHFERLSTRDCVFFESKIWNCMEEIAVDCQRLKINLTDEESQLLGFRILDNSKRAHIVLGCRLKSTWKIRNYGLYVLWSLVYTLRQYKVGDARFERFLSHVDRKIQSELMKEFRTIREPQEIRKLL